MRVIRTLAALAEDSDGDASVNGPGDSDEVAVFRLEVAEGVAEHLAHLKGNPSGQGGVGCPPTTASPEGAEDVAVF